ncbi:MAG: NUDIX domain-containing protein [Acidimicrobiales bacterium]
MSKYSAGILPYRLSDSHRLEVLIVHPGGPFWANKDDGAWSIAKGEYEPAQEPDPLVVAKREFTEELGKPVPRGRVLDLGQLKQPSGKRIVAWALESDIDVSETVSNSFDMEWPPKSGQVQSFPEVDRAAWFPVKHARSKLLKGQVPFLDRLLHELANQLGIDVSELETTDRAASDPNQGS